MKTTLIILGGLILLGGIGLLERGRGGKMTQQGCGASIIGVILLIIGIVVLPATDNPETTLTVTDDTVTPVIYPTIDISECTLGAVFLEDVSIPDNTQLYVGEQFTKTWRIRNTGTCDWENGYQFAFISGEQMGGPELQAIPSVLAGGETDVSIKLIAPDEPGTYRGNWQVCVNEDQCFGDTFYVKIVVVSR